MERREDLVEVDRLSFEDSFPLRCRYVFWDSRSDADKEFSFFDVSVIEAEKVDSFLVTGISSSGSRCSPSVPRHVRLSKSWLLLWFVVF